MEIVTVEEILGAAGFSAPHLNVLVPSSQNYTTLLMQPHGDITVSDSGVCNFDRELAQAQFGSFLVDAAATNADLVITPEYAMPWDVLINAINSGCSPALGKLWVLGCESIKLSQLNQIKTKNYQNATILFEEIDEDENRFLCPLVYVFLAPNPNNEDEPRLVILCQFKTTPMGDSDHFEINRLQLGSKIYLFGQRPGNEIRLLSLICSDAFEFLDPQAQQIYDRALIIHIQLNQKPRHEQFRMYRDRLLRFNGDATEILCLNWARNVKLRQGNAEHNWNNISGSAWYLKSEQFDDRDVTICANHHLGLYYTWLEQFRVHSLYFNYEPAIYLLEATKVVHIGVDGPRSRRRGPQLTRTCLWNTNTGSWDITERLCDGFKNILMESGNANQNIKKLSEDNPLNVERILALASGNANGTRDWFKTKHLESCLVNSSEVIFRITFCQDDDVNAYNFRSNRLRRCSRLWDILSNEVYLPPALKDFSAGFLLDWVASSPHQNAISKNHIRATVIYMGEDVSDIQLDRVKRKLAEQLHREAENPNKSLEYLQRLIVWYRNENSDIVVYEPYEYTQIDRVDGESPVDIGRSE